MNKEILEYLKGYIYTKTGFTVYKDKNELIDIKHLQSYKRGYIVSYKTIIEAKNGELEILTDKLPETCLIGGWFDKEENKYIIELNKHFFNLRNAVIYAEVNNQKAIYDIENDKVLFLKDIKNR